MKTYKIVYKGIFSIDFLKRNKMKKPYFKRTVYYKAYSPEHALAKLRDLQGVEHGHGCSNTWHYEIVSVDEVVGGK